MRESELIVGPAVTVNPPTSVNVEVAELVTVTLRGPTVAVAATLMVAVIWVAELIVAAVTVTPVPLKATVAVEANAVPVRTTVCVPAPWPRTSGVMPFTVRVAALTIENPVSSAPVPPSELVTVIDRVLIVAFAATVTLTSISAALSTVTELMVIPVPEKTTDAPAAKPVPRTVTTLETEPTASEVGAALVGTGRTLTVRAPAVDDVPPSGLSTVTVRGPTAAATSAAMATVSWVSDWTVAAPTVSPVPLKDTVAPLWKPVPVMVNVRATAPWPITLGDSVDATGRATTEIASAAVAVPVSVFVTVMLRGPSWASTATASESVMSVSETMTGVPDSETPAPDSETVAPGLKPVPAILTGTVVPWASEDGVTDAISIPVSTVKALFLVDVPPSAFVTVTLRRPISASAAIETDATSSVGLTKSGVSTRVMPVPENETVAPSWKPEPVTVTSWPTTPCGRRLGDSAVVTGISVIDSTVLAVWMPPSGLVSVSERASSDAVGDTDTVSTTKVDDDTTTLSMVTPVPEKAAVIPDWNPEPLTATSADVAPRPAAAGDSESTTGIGVTVSADSSVDVPPSVLVSVSERTVSAVSVAAESVSVTRTDELTVTELIVMPLPEINAVSPAWNPLPLTTTGVNEAP